MAKGARESMAGVLLLVLVGLGGFNYHRNYKIEQQEVRQLTFSGYDDAGLEALAQAYEAEVEAHRRRYDGARAKRGGVRDTHSVGDGIREFERVQGRTQDVRDATEGLAASEARLREIRDEQRLRSRRAQGWALHLQRLTGVQLPI